MVRLIVVVVGSLGLSRGLAEAPVTFQRIVLSDEYYADGINAGDFNRDGHMDVVSGPFWYAGPGFEVSHPFYPPIAHPPEESPTDSMYSYVSDFNGDDWPDILVIGRVHKHKAYWYENPKGEGTPWRRHFVFERVKGESPPFVDLNQEGHPEVICLWDNRWGWIQPDWNSPESPWSFHAITEPGEYNQFYHGTGVGDLDGDGRLDLILNDGWWRQPAGVDQSPWPAHPYRFAEKGGAQILTTDVDGDGDQDVITSLDAHGWGMAWFENRIGKKEGPFKKHAIMGSREEEEQYGVAFSQPHALALADMDGDGWQDIVAGKRVWAHGPTGDVEPNGTPVIYWFQRRRMADGAIRFVPHLIDDDSGVGVQVVATDVNGDQRPDVLAASKLGAFVLINRSSE